MHGPIYSSTAIQVLHPKCLITVIAIIACLSCSEPQVCALSTIKNIPKKWLYSVIIIINCAYYILLVIYSVRALLVLLPILSIVVFYSSFIQIMQFCASLCQYFQPVVESFGPRRIQLPIQA